MVVNRQNGSSALIVAYAGIQVKHNFMLLRINVEGLLKHVKANNPSMYNIRLAATEPYGQKTKKLT